MKRHWIFLFFLIAPILLFSQEVNDDYLTSQSPSWEILLREWMTEEDIDSHDRQRADDCLGEHAKSA